MNNRPPGSTRAAAAASGRLLVVLLAVAHGRAAAETRSWHSFDATLAGGPRWVVTAHARMRYQSVLGSLQQGRAGAVVRIELKPRWTAIGGYYYGKEEDSLDEWRDFHRPFGGFEAGIVNREGGINLATRGLIERFLGGPRGDFTRFRQRLRLATDRRLGPYVATEWLFDARGYLSSRHSVGLRWRLAPRVSFEGGYLLDLRRSELGSTLHLVTTQLNIELRRRGR